MKLLEEKINTAVSLRNILFATDFSAVSEAALPYATAISFCYGSMVHVAHVVPTSKFPVRPGAVDPTTIGSIYEETHTEAQEMMQRLASRLRGFPHHTYVRHGKLWDVLSEIIRDVFAVMKLKFGFVRTATTLAETVRPTHARPAPQKRGEGAFCRRRTITPLSFDGVRTPRDGICTCEIVNPH